MLGLTSDFHLSRGRKQLHPVLNRCWLGWCLSVIICQVPVLATDFDAKLFQTRMQSSVQKVLPAVVGITQQNANGQITGSFSGVIISEDGYVLSAAHAVNPSRKYDVYLTDGRKVGATGLGSNTDLDCAMLKIDAEGTWPAAEMGKSSTLQVDQPVFGVSYPGLFSPKRAPVVRFGKVVKTISGTSGMIQTTASMEPGDSGGPLLDLDGKVIGIHSQIDKEMEKNFEVPIDSFRLHWDKLKAAAVFQVDETPGLLATGIRPLRGNFGRGNGPGGGQRRGGPGPNRGNPRGQPPGPATPPADAPNNNPPNTSPEVPAPIEMPKAGQSQEEGTPPANATPSSGGNPSSGGSPSSRGNPSPERSGDNNPVPRAGSPSSGSPSSGSPSSGSPSSGTPNAGTPNADNPPPAPPGSTPPGNTPPGNTPPGNGPPRAGGPGQRGPGGPFGRGGNNGQGRGRGGVIVDQVIPGSPADLAGIKSGDRLLQLDGLGIPSFGAFKNDIERRGIDGERVFDVTIRRLGESDTTTPDSQPTEKHVILKFSDPAAVTNDKEPNSHSSDPFGKIPDLVKSFGDLESQLDDMTVIVYSERGNDSMFILATRLKQPNLLVSKSSFVFQNPTIQLANGKIVPAEIVTRDEGDDLVLIRATLPPGPGIDLNAAAGDAIRDHLGELLLTPSPDGDGFVSVLGSPPFASARTENRGYLGVQLENYESNVYISSVVRGSAAQQAGLRAGDKLLMLDKKSVADVQQFIGLVSSKEIGQVVNLKYERDSREYTKDITLGSLSAHVAEDFEGGKSRRRDGFKQVFVHDATLLPSDCGGPIFDIQGNFVGINIARYSRTQAYAIPRAAVKAFVDNALASKQ